MSMFRGHCRHPVAWSILLVLLLACEEPEATPASLPDGGAGADLELGPPAGDTSGDATTGTDSSTAATDADAGCQGDACAPIDSAAPMLVVSPAQLEFVVLLGQTQTETLQVANAGSGTLEITQLDFQADAGFTLATETQGQPTVHQPGAAIVFAPPLLLAPGAKIQLPVTFQPKDELAATGKILIVSNDLALGAVQVTLAGQGVKSSCPLPKVLVKEGNEVVPQTLLHLKGDQSMAAGGAAIAKYEWTVKPPKGASPFLQPNDKFPNPSYMANMAGEYEFCLHVTDANGVQSCVPDCTLVLVVPNNAIHVELTWDTPSDPDPFDNGPAAGADMDLHFAHMLASGPDLDCDGTADPWFNNPFDAFWFNPDPSWGAVNPAIGDDPSMDLDDTDGAGPENLNLDQPEGEPASPMTYAFGVHYWNDHGYGTSLATVRAWLQGTLVLEAGPTPMEVLDMWYVGKLNWPNVLVGGSATPVFSGCAQTGDQCLFQKDPTAPNAGKMWQSSGKACITPCYENKSFTASAGGAAPAKCKVKP